MRNHVVLAALAALPLFACSGGLTKQSTPAIVTITVQGSGTVSSFPAGINCGTACTATFAVGDTIALVAQPADGSALSGWSVSTCTGELCQVTLTGATSITATFATTTVQPKPAKVSVTVAGSGTVTSYPSGIDCGTNCSATYTVGQQVALVATPAAGYTLSGWSSNACSGTLCGLTLTGDTSVTATFAAVTPTPAKVTVTAQGPGTVTSFPAGIDCGSACSAMFTVGEQISLVAQPNQGAVFSGWSMNGCSGTLCGLTLTGDTTVTATFATLTSSQVSVTVGGTGQGTVTSDDGSVSCASGTCTSQVRMGKMLTLTATPATGYYFAGWFGTGACSGTANTCQVTASEASIQTRAMFTAVPFLSDAPLNGFDAYTWNFNLWSMGADGEDMHPVSLYSKVSFDPADADPPTFSADGTLAAVESLAALNGSDSGNNTSNIWVLDMISGKATPITKYGTATALAPRITADGRKVFFLSNLDTSSATEASLPNNANQIWQAATDGSASVALVPGAGTGQYADVEVSPDGTKLAARFFGSNVENLWMMSADGSGAKALTMAQGVSFSSPAWSPDGKSLAYLSKQSLSAPTTSGPGINVWVYDVGTGVSKPLTTFTQGMSTEPPVWSPDGKLIAFSQFVAADGTATTNPNIFVVDPVSGTLTQLTTGSDLHDAPMWAPDSSVVFFTDSSTATNVWKADPTGATPPVPVTSLQSAHASTLAKGFD